VRVLAAGPQACRCQGRRQAAADPHRRAPAAGEQPQAPTLKAWEREVVDAPRSARSPPPWPTYSPLRWGGRPARPRCPRRTSRLAVVTPAAQTSSPWRWRVRRSSALSRSSLSRLCSSSHSRFRRRSPSFGCLAVFDRASKRLEVCVDCVLGLLAGEIELLEPLAIHHVRHPFLKPKQVRLPCHRRIAVSMGRCHGRDQTGN
jgi:hypothetical protein